MKNKIRVAQIGISHEHAPGKIITLQLLGDVFEIAGVVDDRPICHGRRAVDAAPGFLASCTAPRWLTMEQALDRNAVDAVLVEVPNDDLVPVAMKCLEHGMPMHLDKPAGRSLAPYAALLDGCRKRQLPFQMGYMYRGNPALQFIQRMVRDGVLGGIYQIDMDMNHGYGGAPYQEYLGGLPGGIMFNLGCHMIDFAVSVMGVPSAVTPFNHPAPDAPSPEVINNGMVVLDYPHASVCLRACSRRLCGGTSQRRLRLEGTNGWAQLQPVERFDGQPLELHIGLKDAAGGYPPGINVIKFPPQRDRYEPQLLEFAAMVRGEKSSPYTFEHDLLVHRISLAAAGITAQPPASAAAISHKSESR